METDDILLVSDRSQMRLLVVEDEAEMARVLRMGLGEEGHSVVSSASCLWA